MLKVCTRCNKLHKFGACEVKKKYADNRKQTYKTFIKSREWTATSKYIKLLDDFCCLVCKECNCIDYNSMLQVHHIVKVNDDITKALQYDNLITLCTFHHKKAENGNIKAIELKRLIKKYRQKDNNIIM